ncbi:ABC transporter ATP-binding protein [Leuconostoc gasicomitatum]|uniref:ABC transporter ATP-binding protein n=1 Tax=Leuconostoc gasicomitatum TaxID=115778 RepID=UPI001CC4725A|nr:ABC transporter ATP-binding protein [Leuconostoc gasicomitatum]MBZ5997291.1 ABC transporter ATP-binding protein [Leuconostoc gasicomitatum]
MENNQKNLLVGIKKYGKPYFVKIIIGFVLALIGSLATLIGPNQLSKITNLITEGLVGSLDITKINHIVFVLMIIYVVGSIMSYGEGFLMANVSQNLTRDLRSKISQKINRLPLSYFDTHDNGDTLSRVTNDLDTFGQSLNQSLGTIVSSVVLIIGSIILMTYTNWLLSLTAIITTVIGMITIIFLLSHSQTYFDNQQKQLAEVSGFVEEIYTGHEVVKRFNNIKNVQEKFVSLNNNLYMSAWKSQFLSGIMQPLMIFIGNFSYVAVCVIGALLVLKGSISIGIIVAFMVYVRIFTQPLSQIAQSLSSLQSAQAALRRVFVFLDEEEVDNREDAAEYLSKSVGEIEFDHVNFGYSKDNLVIKDFSLKISPGQKVAIVGPTGAGKTTLISLLMRYYDYQSGKIKIDDIDISHLSTATVRNQFDMVLQDTWLFDDTIMANLKYNQPNIDDDKVIEAAKSIGIDHFIRTLPNGYDTVINESVSLSVGQKQLLTIVRALIRNKPMLILDEATSSVDTRTEEQLQKAMDVLSKGRTSLVIAHRLSTIKNADNIVVLNQGRIVESGNHSELMHKQGFYANLYNSQFESLIS